MDEYTDSSHDQQHLERRETTVEGPRWRLPGGDTGTHWRVRLGLRCPYCADAPELEYLPHSVSCPTCWHRFEPVQREDVDIRSRCPWCAGPMDDDGELVWCRHGNEPSHAPRSAIRATPDYGSPCTDCGRPCDVAGTGRVCRECVLRSYLEVRFGQFESRRFWRSTDAEWRTQVGFARDAEVGGKLAAGVGGDPDRKLRIELYGVEAQGPYRDGQIAWVGGAFAGNVLLCRVTDATGFIYEAALPAGDAEAPDSVALTAEQRRFRKRSAASATGWPGDEPDAGAARRSRKQPYPDRVILPRGSALKEEQVADFERSVRQWLVNEYSKLGRRVGSYKMPMAEFRERTTDAYRALHQLRPSRRPTLGEVAIAIDMRESTFKQQLKAARAEGYRFPPRVQTRVFRTYPTTSADDPTLT